jgi:hypothetical protein
MCHSEDSQLKERKRENYRASAFFGKVPRSILYDNTTLAVARILGGGVRQRTRVFNELQSHYVFEDAGTHRCRGDGRGPQLSAKPSDCSLGTTCCLRSY